MGQKINPISFRLQQNRSVDCSWYSQTNYAEFCLQFISLQRYIQSIFQLSRRFVGGRVSMDLFPNKMNASVIVYQQPERTPFKQPRVKASRKKGKSSFVNTHHPLGLYPKDPAILLSKAYQQAYIQQKYAMISNPSNSFLPAFSSFLTKNQILSKACYSVTQEGTRLRRPWVESEFVQTNLTRDWYYPQDTFLGHVEDAMERTTRCHSQLFVMRTTTPTSSAEFVMKEITKGLERKSSLNMIWKRIRTQLVANPSIQGARVTVSGRVNGIEMARTEVRKYGQTSLHTISNQMDYAVGEAYTSYGILGVKVWICFHSTP